jgi:hypothetical protein
MGPTGPMGPISTECNCKKDIDEINKAINEINKTIQCLLKKCAEESFDFVHLDNKVTSILKATGIPGPDQEQFMKNKHCRPCG